ncbi:hypothetical protein [Caulobacter sp.]|uniref:hypothetical protein n=1 Tax=Caulobacter sp. TaxID=78 RepID=UPI001B013F9F|nr:hypothetical protein [Caulobacter sp.]MBO9544302.1 hypothetical protein [Caulobacter sp.]
MTLVSQFSKAYQSNRLVRALVYGIAAAPLGYLFGRWLGGLKDFGEWNPAWPDMMAALLGVFMVGLGIGVLAVCASRKALGRQLDPEGGRPATKAQVFFYAQNGVVLLLAGVMMVTPVAVSTAFETVPPLVGSAAMVGLIALFLLQTAMNISVWIRSDELMRQAMTEVGALCFVVLQGAMFLWAAGGKLGLLPVMTLWDAVPVMMAVYLLIGFGVTWRRGLAA